MITTMHKITNYGHEWHVDVFRKVGSNSRLTKIYVLGRNDGAGPRHYKTFRREGMPDIKNIPIPKRFGDALLAYVQMRGET